MAISVQLTKGWSRDLTRLGYINYKTGEFIGEAELSRYTTGDLDKIARFKKEEAMKTKKEELQKKKVLHTPGKVRNFKCVKCGELLLRVYPWANVQINEDAKMVCKKCQ